MKENKIRNLLEHFWYAFLIAAISLFILSLFATEIPFINRLILILIAASIFSIVWGTISLLFSKYVRPKIYKYFVNHKNLKALVNYGFMYEEEYQGYYRNYRKFEVQIGYVYENVALIKSNYQISVLFNKGSAVRIKQVRKSKAFKDGNIKAFAEDRLLSFNFFPPKTEKIIALLDEIIDSLIENEIEPIRPEDI